MRLASHYNHVHAHTNNNKTDHLIPSRNPKFYFIHFFSSLFVVVIVLWCTRYLNCWEIFAFVRWKMRVYVINSCAHRRRIVNINHFQRHHLSSPDFELHLALSLSHIFTSELLWFTMWSASDILFYTIITSANKISICTVWLEHMWV